MSCLSTKCACASRIRISQLYGLNLVLYHTSGLVPLLATGNSSNISKLFTRYLSTLLHVTSWFEHDPFDKERKCYQSLKLVRGLHRQVGEKMNKGVSVEKNGSEMLWINQYGMAHAQFSFVGFMAVFPKEVRASKLTHGAVCPVQSICPSNDIRTVHFSFLRNS